MRDELRFQRLLVANRGEIAARVLKAARGLGLSTVAVYSEADRNAPDLGLADVAVPIGPSVSGRVLFEPLRADRGRKAHFSDSGPSRLRLFVRERSFRTGVCRGRPDLRRSTCLCHREDEQEERAAVASPKRRGSASFLLSGTAMTTRLLASVMSNIGFPALIKAVAGGGGKAMHVVADQTELRSALAAARTVRPRGLSGITRIMVERFIEHGRHIEVQVVADEFGNVVHLFERDCSVQRRHQKVIEEAPAPSLDEVLRERLFVDAVRLARSVGYLNVGTVEFLVAGETAYFLEMNTRLQVEHRVTEAVTGLDLRSYAARDRPGHATWIHPGRGRLRGSRNRSPGLCRGSRGRFLAPSRDPELRRLSAGPSWMRRSARAWQSRPFTTRCSPRSSLLARRANDGA